MSVDSSRDEGYVYKPIHRAIDNPGDMFRKLRGVWTNPRKQNPAVLIPQIGRHKVKRGIKVAAQQLVKVDPELEARLRKNKQII